MNLADIEEQRTKLKSNYERYMAALDAVAELVGSTTDTEASAAAVVLPPEPARPAKPAKPVSKPAKPASRPVPVRAGRTDANTLRMVDQVRRLKEPFRAGDIMIACGCDSKKAQNFCTQGTSKGWLTRTGHGEYTRTKTFGVPAGRKHQDNGVSAQSASLLDQIHQEIAEEKAAASSR